jgi:hypothetical protein
MQSTLKAYKYPISLFLLLLLGMFCFEWLIWGQDGLSLWMPVLAEYLRGNYENSSVIFGGQNLLALYGELPFWKIFYLFNASPLILLNFTYYILLLFFYTLTLQIFTGLTGKKDSISQIIIFIYCLLSPIFLNRVYSGHFNLLFGMLPFLVSLALIYNRSRIFDIFCMFILVCAFTIQGSQILAYHLFYIPVLFLWAWWTFGNIPFWYIKKLIIITVVAIILSSPIMYEMIKHSTSVDNLRSGISNLVYSYLISSTSDLGSLFMSSVNEFTTRNDFFKFHELNYPLGLTFLSFFFLKGEHRKILLSLLVTSPVLFAFSANWPVFNLFSKIPLISLFRVPQRSLMLASYVAPLFFLVWFKEYINFKSIIFLLAFILVGNGLPYFELYCLIMVLTLLLTKKWKQYSEITFALIFSTLFLGLPDKYVALRDSNEEFMTCLQIMKKIDNTYHLSRDRVKVHLVNNEPISMIAAANYLGIPTVEGYGHPPKRHFNQAAKLLPLVIDPTTNMFILDVFQGHPNFKQALISLGVERIIVIGYEGNFKQILLKD